MDALTHALAGTLVADALPFTRRLGRKAPLVAAIAAVAPDFDMLPAFIANFPPRSLDFFDLVNVEMLRLHHRAYTHAFFFIALACLPLGWLAWRWSGKRGVWPLWSLLVALAALSHTLLDMTTRWNVRIWLPFSNQPTTWSGPLGLFNPSIIAILAVVFVLNHVLREGCADAGDAPLPESGRRSRFADRLDRLASVTAVAWAGMILVVGRILLAIF